MNKYLSCRETEITMNLKRRGTKAKGIRINTAPPDKESPISDRSVRAAHARETKVRVYQTRVDRKNRLSLVRVSIGKPAASCPSPMKSTEDETTPELKAQIK